jgi:glutamyl-tRNA reductase
MVFVACGINHTTAPITIREEIAQYFAAPEEILNALLKFTPIQEAVILSTCNRTECYFEGSSAEDFINWLVEQQNIPRERLTPYFYSHTGIDAIRHVLRVASGLDSMMLGEPQILGQMKQAYQQACQINAVKTSLRPLFEHSFAASKRIRSQSGIGEHPVSVAYAAIQLINQSFSNLAPLQVFLIGSGDTASLVAKYLQKQGIQQLYIASRTLENAKKLATSVTPLTTPHTQVRHPEARHPERVFLREGSPDTGTLYHNQEILRAKRRAQDDVLGVTTGVHGVTDAHGMHDVHGMHAQALTINDIPAYLSKADIIISATACPLPFIHKPMVEQALKEREGAPMFFMDLSLPRDIDPDVGSLENVLLYNIDDLQNRVDNGMAQRRNAAIQAEAMVNTELNNYILRHKELRAKDMICSYREQMQALADEELKRARAHLAKGLDQEQVLFEFSRRMLDKLSHYPMLGLKKAAIDGREDLLSLVPYLFNPTCDYLSHEEIA